MNHIYLNKDIQPKGASVVYWIHAPEHKDMLNEGYIGITKNGVNHRWRQHSRDIRNLNNQHKVYETLKQQPTLIFEIVVIAKSREYCEDIEAKLRPTHGIGWNVAKGGRDGFAKRGGEQTKERWLAIYTPCDHWYKAEMLMLRQIKRKEKLAAKRLAREEYLPFRGHTTRKLAKDNTTGLTGVGYYPKYNLYRAQICIDRTIITLGYYQTKEDAHQKYLKAKSLVKEFRDQKADSRWMIAQVNR